MTPDAIRPAALDALEATAREIAAAESELRETFAQEIARIEVERRRAYRRFNFLAALVAADASAPDRETSRRAQRAAAIDELEWDGAESRLPEMLDALEPLADAVHDERVLETAEAEESAEPCAVPIPVSDAEAPGAAREAGLLLALAAFEARFEELQGRPFAEQFDRHMPETPLVDF